MSNTNDNVKPYLRRIKNWKIRNMVLLYLEAREKFLTYRELLEEGVFISFERMWELCDMLYEVKEDHHLLYKRLLDPGKKKFETALKFMPNEIELQFMNNVGLLFHKLMVARELRYQTEHYVEKDETFHRNEENLQIHLRNIGALFEDGIGILKSLVVSNRDNPLLLTLLLENIELAKNHLGDEARDVIRQLADASKLDDIYCSVGAYYLQCGWTDKAKTMFSSALKENARHKEAKQQLSRL